MWTFSLKNPGYLILDRDILKLQKNWIPGYFSAL